MTNDRTPIEDDWDRDGYPTDEVLLKIEEWKIEKFADCRDLLTYIKPIWKYADQGYYEIEKINGRSYYKLSTGGWSGNESIVDSLMHNFFFKSISWYSSKRGGHYVFECRDDTHE